MVVTENCSSDWDTPLSSLLPPSAPSQRRRIRPQGNPPPPPPNLFGKLVDDLLVDILIRLPNPRSSCRCKAVCKRWRSLLSDPSFDRRFVSHHQIRYQPASLFLHSRDPQSILSFLPVPDEARPELRVFDCFKDLLLCGFAKYNSELGRSFLVCNPFTKQWIALPLAPEMPEESPNYYQTAAALVSQPRCSSSSKYNLVQQLGDGDEAEAEPAFVYSEYSFRVVCLFQYGPRQIVQVYCFEPGKWEQLFLDRTLKRPTVNAISWNEKLFWVHVDMDSRSKKLAAYNPFSLHKPPESMDVPSALWRVLRKRHGWNISVSQGAFHIIILQVEGSRKSLSVLRLEKDGEYWTQLYEKVLKITSSSLWGDYVLEHCGVLGMHPEKPEVVFFEYMEPPQRIISCNLRTGTGEPEFFSAICPGFLEPCWRVLQPRVSCWPTPIPWYEELRGIYDGSYDCWVQNSRTTTTLPSTIAEECQASVEQSGRRRKGKKSAAALHPMPCGRRKQKVCVV